MFEIKDNMLQISRNGETVVICAQGRDALRVRATMNCAFDARDWALEDAAAGNADIRLEGDSAVITNGAISARVDRLGKIRFYRSGVQILEEYYRCYEYDMPHTPSLRIVAREYKPIRGGDYECTLRFEAQREKLYGMGQYQQDCLDLKGCTLELAQRNSQASVPFLLSSLGYGFLFNQPAVGKATFAKNVTEWHVESVRQLDYWITVGTPKQILANYTALAGRAPEFPENALGLWQCKLRYRTQEEVLSVAREYHRRGIPLDVIVIDFFHWTRQGEWKFDPVYWPDPAAMVRELKSYGIRCMISVWPTVDKKSENFAEMRQKGLLIRPERGSQCFDFLGDSYLYDATNPAAQAYLWDKCRRNYFEDGIDMFWLDEAEPEYTAYDFDNYRYYLGTDLQVGNVYPVMHAKAFWDGQTAAGQKDICNLIRCVWAGSQKYGVVLWSGDIIGNFETLRDQFAAGLNVSLAGIPWWTTDIGGFFVDVTAPGHKELLIRWFEWATFCPVLRLHGDKGPCESAPLDDRDWGGGFCHTGRDNELWSYGEDVYEILKHYVAVREQMKPYLKEVMREASENGSPVMRAMFYEFPDDPMCWEADEQYMFGSRYLVAPVLYAGVTEREIYLPAGKWKNIATGEVLAGGRKVTVAAPLEVIPVFEKL